MGKTVVAALSLRGQLETTVFGKLNYYVKVTREYSAFHNSNYLIYCLSYVWSSIKYVIFVKYSLGADFTGYVTGVVEISYSIIIALGALLRKNP